MKSMETFSHGLLGVERGLYSPYFFFVYGLCDLTFNTSAHKLLYILFHFGPIKSLSYGHSCPFCMSTPLIMKLLTLVWTSNGSKVVLPIVKKLL
jgi:hypothetical protein